MISEIKARARGSWAEVISNNCEVALESLNGQHGPCPCCGGKDRFRVFDDFAETGGVICNQCGSFPDGISTTAWLRSYGCKEAVKLLADYFHISGVAKSQLTDGERSIRGRVYQMIIESLSLSDGHRALLKQRGLSEDAIDRNGYASLSKGDHGRLAQQIDQSLKTGSFPGLETTSFDELAKRVPGLLLNEHGVPQLRMLFGILIPIRSADGMIAALVVRRNEGTSNAELPKYLYLSASKKQREERHARGGVEYPKAEYAVHVPADVSAGTETVRVTEGVLKADIATALSGVLTIGIPGVNGWKRTIPVLQKLSANRVVIALDADHKENPAVADAVTGLTRECVAKGFAAAIETWEISDGKGIDDLLANGHQPKLIEGDAVEKYLKEHVDPIAAKLRKTKPQETQSKQNHEAVDDPHRLARTLIERRFTVDGVCVLKRWRGEWHHWDGVRYVRRDDSELRDEITRHAKQEFDQAIERQLAAQSQSPKAKRAKTLKVTRSLVGNTMQALESLTHLPRSVEQPQWIGNEPAPFDMRYAFATQNGLLNVNTQPGSTPVCIPSTPMFFSGRAVEYGFDSSAACPEWRQFLDSIWPGDPASISLLQEWFGYCLTDDTSQHKFLLTIGPPRSGKSTKSRVLKALIGAENVASPTLGGLAGPFCLWPLLGKTLAIFPDARLSGRADAVAVVERLLSIVGEDPQDIDRKFLPPLTAVQMSIRFLLMSNEIPTLSDASGAIVTRSLILRMTRSFVGSEDRHLSERLLAELPGILNWSIEGWQRLRQRGEFVQPESGQELLDDLKRQASPISEFIDDCCDVGPDFSVPVKDLIAAWKHWCAEHGRDRTWTEATIGKNVRAVVPGLCVSRPRVLGGRVRVYTGVGLKEGILAWRECPF
jgi:putative DNA primase/helicase